jgi:hypothetical protein
MGKMDRWFALKTEKMRGFPLNLQIKGIFWL